MQYEASLVEDVAKLREELAQLNLTKSIYQQRTLLFPNMDCRSLVHLTREFFHILANGLECREFPGSSEFDPRKQSIVEYKETFMRQVIDPNVVFGDFTGVDAVIDQWRKYTAAFGDLEIKVVDSAVSVHGSEEDPVLEMPVKMRVRFTYDTFRLVFPYALHRGDLIRLFIGKVVTFDNAHHFRFSPDGRIKLYVLEINFVEALVNAVGNAESVAELLQLSLISPRYTLGDVAHDASSMDTDSEEQDSLMGQDEAIDGSWTGSDDRRRRRSPSWVTDLEMPFLLDEDSTLDGNCDVDSHESICPLQPSLYDDTEQFIDL